MLLEPLSSILTHIFRPLRPASLAGSLDAVKTHRENTSGWQDMSQHMELGGIMENTSKDNVIVSWVGAEDVRIARAFCARNGIDGTREEDIRSCTVLDGEGANGPVRTLTDWLLARQVYLLAAADTARDAGLIRAFVERGTKAACTVVETGVTDPFSHEEVWQATEAFLARNWSADAAASFNFHLTAGTPAMQAALFYASQVRYAGGHAWRTVDPSLAAADGTQCFEVRLPFRLPAELWSASCGVCLADAALSSEILKIYAPVRTISILVMGEAGVGKSLFARQIHNACAGHRNNFVEVHCATLAAGPFADFAAALFGRQGEDGPCPGAFEKARGGTLYLNGVEHLPAEWQAVLVRTLTEREYEVPGGAKRRVDNVRIVASTARELALDVSAGLFRQDLFTLIAMCPVRLLSLRDIIASDSGRFAAIIEEILASLGREANELSRSWQLTRDAMDMLRVCPWPGNVQELRQVLLLSCVRALARQSEVITGQDIERHLTMVRPQAPAVCTPEPAAAPATLVAPVAPAPVVEENAPAALVQKVEEEPEALVQAEIAQEAAQESVPEAPAPVAVSSASEEADDFLPSNLEQWLADKRMEFINKALAMCDGSKARAGKLLGLTYQQMLYFEKRAGQPVTGRRGRRRKNAEEIPAEEVATGFETTSAIAKEPSQPEAPVDMLEEGAASQDVPQDAPQESTPIVAEQSLFASAVLDAESVNAKAEEEVKAETDANAQPEGGNSSEPSIDEIANHIVAQMLKSDNGKDE